MDLSEATGTPLGKRAACSSCVVPAETSVTEPLMTKPDPRAILASGASTVNALGPLPTL